MCLFMLLGREAPQARRQLQNPGQPPATLPQGCAGTHLPGQEPFAWPSPAPPVSKDGEDSGTPQPHSFHQDQDSRKTHCSRHPYFFPTSSHHTEPHTDRLHRAWAIRTGYPEPGLVQGKPALDTPGLHPAAAPGLQAAAKGPPALTPRP